MTKLSQTCLLPSVIIVFVSLGVKILYFEYKWATEENSHKDEGVILTGPNRTKPMAGIVYTCIQGVAFTSLAIMIMRMKLFMTPQLCIGKSFGTIIL